MRLFEDVIGRPLTRTRELTDAALELGDVNVLQFVTAQSKVLRRTTRRHRCPARLLEGRLRPRARAGIAHRRGRRQGGMSVREAHGRAGDRGARRRARRWRSGSVATGRLELRWRPATGGRKDERHGHDDGRKRRAREEEGRVQGDKAVLDAEAVKAAGLQSEPVAHGLGGGGARRPGRGARAGRAHRARHAARERRGARDLTRPAASGRGGRRRWPSSNRPSSARRGPRTTPPCRI